MSHRVLGLLITFSLVGNVAAQQPDRKQVRDLIELPNLSILVGAALSPEGDIYINGETPDWPAQAATLEKELRGDLADAARYCKLAWLLGDKARRAQVVDKALDLARRQLQTDPANGRFTMVMAHALWIAEQDAEAEKHFRQAVQLAPQDFECSLQLGFFLSMKASRELLAEPIFKEFAGPDLFFAIMSGQLPTEKVRIRKENIETSRKILAEADRCYDRAVALAGASSKPYLARAGYGMSKKMNEWLQHADEFKQNPSLATANLIGAPEIVSDVAKAAEMSPAEPRIQTTALLFEFLAHAKALAEARKSDLDPERWRKKLLVYTQRLEKLVDHEDAKIAGQACFGLGLVESIMDSKDTTPAKKWLLRSLELQPDHDKSWETLFALTAKENQQASIALCEERLKRRDTARNRAIAAEACFRASQEADAQKHCRAGVRVGPTDPAVHLGLAALLLRRGTKEDLAEAEGLLSRAEKLLEGRNDLSLQSDAATLRAFHYLLSAGNQDEKQARKSAAALCSRGDLWFNKKDNSRAISLYDLSIHLDPSNPWMFSRRGAALFRLKKFDEAMKDHDEALRLDPKLAWVLCNRGVIRLAMKDLERAMQDLDEAISLDGKNARAHGARGMCWVMKNDDDRAIADFDAALRLDPSDPLTFSSRAGCWFRKNDFDRAIDDYSEALRLNPADIHSLINRGSAHRHKKQYDEAIKDFTAVLELNPKDLFAVASRAAAWFDKADYDRALEDLDIVLTFTPKNAFIHYQKTRCLARLGKSDAALECLTKAFELGWNNFEMMASDRAIETLRNDPRYDELLKRYKK